MHVRSRCFRVIGQQGRSKPSRANNGDRHAEKRTCMPEKCSCTVAHVHTSCTSMVTHIGALIYRQHWGNIHILHLSTMAAASDGKVPKPTQLKPVEHGVEQAVCTLHCVHSLTEAEPDCAVGATKQQHRHNKSNKLKYRIEISSKVEHRSIAGEYEDAPLLSVPAAHRHQQHYSCAQTDELDNTMLVPSSHISSNSLTG